MDTDTPFPSERAEHPAFEARVAAVCARPTMYVLERSVASVAAYLSGYDAALGGAPLLGFQQWLVVRGDIGNNQHWIALAAKWSAPRLRPGASPEGQEDEAIRALGAVLEEYFVYRRNNGITKVFHEYGKWLLRRSWYRGPLRGGSTEEPRAGTAPLEALQRGREQTGRAGPRTRGRGR